MIAELALTPVVTMQGTFEGRNDQGDVVWSAPFHSAPLSLAEDNGTDDLDHVAVLGTE
jgi:hypothetical protein